METMNVEQYRAALLAKLNAVNGGTRQTAEAVRGEAPTSAGYADFLKKQQGQ